ncbi:MAG: hypothetical protein HY660_17025 [Armatimonadetes bacterium]|nr:hypothetical protein [Armatimonadota bacterium]
MDDGRRRYGLVLLLLIAAAAVCAVGVLVGELTGRWNLGGVFLGVLLIVYSFIVLVLRKGGFTQA